MTKTATFRGVPEKLKNEFKLVCVAKGKKMGIVISELMRLYISNPRIISEK